MIGRVRATGSGAPDLQIIHHLFLADLAVDSCGLGQSVHTRTRRSQRGTKGPKKELKNERYWERGRQRLWEEQRELGECLQGGGQQQRLLVDEC